MEHTPGPWKVDVSTDSFGWENYTINDGVVHSEEERQANVRLLSETPDLLKAVEELLSHPSDDPMDATNTEDGFFLTPLQIAERNVRRLVHKISG